MSGFLIILWRVLWCLICTITCPSLGKVKATFMFLLLESDRRRSISPLCCLWADSACTVPGGFELQIFRGHLWCFWWVLLLTAHGDEMWSKGNAKGRWIPHRITRLPNLSSVVPFSRTGVPWAPGWFAVAEGLLSLSASLNCQVHILHVLIMGCYAFLWKHNTDQMWQSMSCCLSLDVLLCYSHIQMSNLQGLVWFGGFFFSCF